MLKNIIFLILLVIIYSASFQCVNAEVYKEIKGTNLQIEKNGGWIPYQLRDKKTRKCMLPGDYRAMDYFLYKGKPIIYAIKDYIILFSPDLSFGNFLNNYYAENNKIHKIKFYNYPKSGVLNTGRYSNANMTHKKDLGYSKAFVKDNYIILEYENVRERTIDADSLISKILGVSFYSNDNKSYKSYSIITLPGNIKENIQLYKDELVIKYEGASEHTKIDLMEYENIKGVTKQQQEQFEDEVLKVDSLSELYKYISKTTHFDFKNYPLTAALIVKNKFIIFENNKKTIYDIEQESELSGITLEYSVDNSVINKVTGLNIWFGDIDNIIFNNNYWGDIKYGIIDKNLNVKVPMEYSKIYKVGGQTIEKCLNSDNLQTSQLIFQYEGQKKQEKFFIAKKCDSNKVCVKSRGIMQPDSKCNTFGVISDNNEIIIPFEDYSFYNFNTTSELDCIAKKAYNRQKRKENIFYFIFSFIIHIFGL